MKPLLIEKFPPLDLAFFVNSLRLYKHMRRDEKLQLVEKVISAHPLLNINAFIKSHLYRARNIDGIDINFVDDVIWPKTKPEKANRFGDLCYLANTPDTALAETEDGKREVVVITRFELIDQAEVKVFPVGEQERIMRGARCLLINEDMVQKIVGLIHNSQLKAPEATRSLLLQEAFITAELAAGDKEVTAYAIGRILDRLAGQDIEAVMYSSTKREGGYNLGALTELFWDKLV